MITRRRTVQTGLATLLSAAAPFRAFAQSKPRTKVRYNEVVRSLLYAPAYVALTKGYFKDAGLDVAMTTAFGGDKSTAALLSNTADIALIGPETAIYVLNSDSTTKIRIFCGLTSTDGFMLVGREKVDKFDWKMLKGKEILGFRPGSTPLLFLEEALRMNGIDPQKDVKLNNNVAIPARVGSWLAGQNQYAHLHRAGRRRSSSSTARRIHAGLDRPDRRLRRLHLLHGDRQVHQGKSRGLQSWTNAIAKAMKWTAQRADPRARASARAVLPGRQPEGDDAAAERYRRLKIWKTTPVIEPKADREVPGHPGARQRARSVEAGEVPGPGPSPSSPTRRSDPCRHRPARRIAEGRAARRRPALLRRGRRDRGAQGHLARRSPRASSSPSSARAAAARARCCR